MNRALNMHPHEVIAALEDRLSAVIRPVKPQPPENPTTIGGKRWGLVDSAFYYCGIKCPLGAPGDRLWGRETWAEWYSPELMSGRPSHMVGYRAGRVFLVPPKPYHADFSKWERVMRQPDIKPEDANWRSPVTMPAWASRITLEATRVRAVRVREISEVDAKAWGVEPYKKIHNPRPGFEGWFDVTDEQRLEWGATYKDGFQFLWDSHHAKKGLGYDANPWAWLANVRKVK